MSDPPHAVNDFRQPGSDLRDDLGQRVRLDAPARRVVSLVPSLTEAVAVSAPEALIGATDWCTQPRGLDVVRVRGTKNPNVRAIVELQPDLVIANQEENRALDVQRLRDAGIQVWVTRISTVDEALTSMARLFSDCFDIEPGWLLKAQEIWREPAPASGPSVALPVWKAPWIWAGPNTYGHDVLTHLGFRNVFGDGPDVDRYPHAPVDDRRVRNADLVALPSEPYEFTDADLSDFAARSARLVDGRWLFWYGPAMVEARQRLAEALRPSPNPEMSPNSA